ncbi:MAG: hypothetical protein RJQ21_07940, partial [Rhodospirillales bacterium]
MTASSVSFERCVNRIEKLFNSSQRKIFQRIRKCANASGMKQKSPNDADRAPETFDALRQRIRDRFTG